MRWSGMACVTVAGCSFAMHEAPSYPVQPGDCSDSYAAPIADTLGVVYTLGATALAGVGAAAEGGARDGIAVATLLVPMPIAYGIAAAHGYRVAARCREAMAEAPAPRAPDNALMQPDSDPPAAVQPHEPSPEDIAKGRMHAELDQLRARYEASHEPELLYEIANGNALLGKCEVATVYYRRYLADAPVDSAKTEQVNARIASCGQREATPPIVEHAAPPLIEPPASTSASVDSPHSRRESCDRFRPYAMPMLRGLRGPHPPVSGFLVNNEHAGLQEIAIGALRAECFAEQATRFRLGATAFFANQLSSAGTTGYNGGFGLEAEIDHPLAWNWRIGLHAEADLAMRDDVRLYVVGARFHWRELLVIGLGWFDQPHVFDPRIYNDVTKGLPVSGTGFELTFGVERLPHVTEQDESTLGRVLLYGGAAAVVLTAYVLLLSQVPSG